MSSRKYSSIKEQTPHKGSIFSSSESSANASAKNSRANSPFVPQKPQKKGNAALKILLVTSILITLASIALFVTFAPNISHILNKCPEGEEKLNMFCVSNSTIADIKKFCESEIKADQLNETQKENLKYCQMFYYKGKVYPMLSTKANIAVSLTLLIVSFTTTLIIALCISKK